MTPFDATLLRLLVFVGVFSVLAVAERFKPRRSLTLTRRARWPTNLAIILLDSIIVRVMANLAIPIAAVAAAIYCSTNGYGFFNQVDWPTWLEAALSIAALDFAIWLQHVASHKIGILWLLHQMHHADRDIDVTTAIRFHPIEIVLSMVWKIIVVAALGVNAYVVLAFEILLNAGAIFSHANIRLPARADRVLRLVFVTPDMHRVHHSVERREHDSNYGFNLSIWDRLFGTYTAQPARGHEGMQIGLRPYQSADPTRLGWSLMLPFRTKSREKS